MRDNGTLRLITIFVAIIGLVTGLVVGGYSWTSSNFVHKSSMSYIRESLLDIKTDIKEIKVELRESRYAR